MPLIKLEANTTKVVNSQHSGSKVSVRSLPTTSCQTAQRKLQAPGKRPAPLAPRSLPKPHPPLRRRHRPPEEEFGGLGSGAGIPPAGVARPHWQEQRRGPALIGKVAIPDLHRPGGGVRAPPCAQRRHIHPAARSAFGGFRLPDARVRGEGGVSGAALLEAVPGSLGRPLGFGVPTVGGPLLAPPRRGIRLSLDGCARISAQLHYRSLCRPPVHVGRKRSVPSRTQSSGWGGVQSQPPKHLITEWCLGRACRTNRGGADQVGADGPQTRVTLRALLHPGAANLGRARTQVLHSPCRGLGLCNPSCLAGTLAGFKLKDSGNFQVLRVNRDSRVPHQVFLFPERQFCPQKPQCPTL